LTPGRICAGDHCCRRYDDVYRTCAFPLKGLPGPACAVKLEEASLQVGPHNIYDIYDNCPQTTAWLQRAGKSMRWLKNYLRAQLDNGTAATAGNAAGQLLLQMSGGCALAVCVAKSYD
jgi:hypothetical protein